MNIENKQSEFAALEADIEKSEALLGGTKAMRAAKEKYLPKMTREDPEDYDRRLNTSVLHAVYAETISQMVGRVFFSPVDRADAAIDEAYLDDFDNGGNDIDSVLQTPFAHALSFGRAYAVVSVPAAEDIKTAADEKAAGIRPYAVVIHPKNVLGIRRTNDKITHFRYSNTYLSEDENFEEKEVKEIIIHEPGNVRRYVDNGDGFGLVDNLTVGTNGAPFDFVPVAELIFEPNKLPLGNLADLNIKHWQSQSDQDNILSFARVPMLAAVGVAQDDDIEVGGTISYLPNGGDMKWVEHSGAAIEAGRKSIEDLELRCQAEGAKLLVKSKISLTDRQAKDEAAKEISKLRQYANLLEDFTDKLLYFYARYLGQEDGGKIKISGNIDDTQDVAASVDAINSAYLNGLISAQTAYNELKRLQVIKSNNDWEVEQELIGEQSTL